MLTMYFIIATVVMVAILVYHYEKKLVRYEEEEMRLTDENARMKAFILKIDEEARKQDKMNRTERREYYRNIYTNH